MNEQFLHSSTQAYASEICSVEVRCDFFFLISDDF
uniref:Uncharacterized protein n=1 Tax=Arundo donax TaxID=35708 RepID=A0A0A9F784_ARUDO